MNKFLLVLILFSLLFSAAAKPGESYVLTGREKSILSIYQAEIKAFPKLYAGEDINKCYNEFKALNNLYGRKLTPGEELIFPHTKKSKEAEEAAKEETASSNPKKQPEETCTLFGSSTPSEPQSIDPDAERERAEAQRKEARQKAVYYFQHMLLPNWMHYNSNEIIEQGRIDVLAIIAREKVDEEFSASLVLHRYPKKGIYIIEFEEPNNVGEYFFVALKMESGSPLFYVLEKGISFFGAGDEGVLFEWESDGTVSRLGGREYSDLSSFLQELETGLSVDSAEE